MSRNPPNSSTKVKQIQAPNTQYGFLSIHICIPHIKPQHRGYNADEVIFNQLQQWFRAKAEHAIGYLKRLTIFGSKLRIHIDHDYLAKMFDLAMNFNFIANKREGLRPIEFIGNIEDILGLRDVVPLAAPDNAPDGDRDLSRGWGTRNLRDPENVERIRVVGQRNNVCQCCGEGGELIECDICYWSWHRRCLSPPMALDFKLRDSFVFCCCQACSVEMHDEL
eukprot:TRINITY_DN1853_c0_g1_i5.p1 TRINITY_DN1853_c0_g1~~TRINITY_DN1853_c0_g1_i5.p1  ORF type:complete len:222 (-),score=41.92 TRINITY_DN1853_c0_g1_i5:81-746(-)